MSGLRWKREGFNFIFRLLSNLRKLSAMWPIRLKGYLLHSTFACMFVYIFIYKNIQMSTMRHAHLILILRIGVNGIFFPLFFCSRKLTAIIIKINIQFSSVAQSCPTLCNPMNRSMPGLPVHHQLPEFTQTHAHRVGDAIQPSHPLSSPSPPAPNPSQHQGLFQ